MERRKRQRATASQTPTNKRFSKNTMCHCNPIAHFNGPCGGCFKEDCPCDFKSGPSGNKWALRVMRHCSSWNPGHRDDLLARLAVRFHPATLSIACAVVNHVNAGVMSVERGRALLQVDDFSLVQVLPVRTPSGVQCRPLHCMQELVLSVMPRSHSQRG